MEGEQEPKQPVASRWLVGKEVKWQKKVEGRGAVFYRC